MHLIFNILIFFVILNLNWFFDKVKAKPNHKTIGELFTVPLLLGITLTIVDSLRIIFIYRILIFIILSLIMYMIFSKYKKFIKERKS